MTSALASDRDIGWGAVAMYDHTLVFDPLGGKAEFTRCAVGWLRRLSEADLGVSLVRDSRWAIGIAASPTAPNFLIIPGCNDVSSPPAPHAPVPE